MAIPDLDPDAALRAVWPGLAAAAGLTPEGHMLRVMALRGGPRPERVLGAVDGPDGAFVLKRAAQADELWFDRQVAAHRMAEAAFAGAEGLAVPRLLAVDRPGRTMLMDLVPGPTAHEAALAADGPAARLDVLRQGARWLGHLHRAAPPQLRRFRPVEALARLRRIRARAGPDGPGVPEPGAFAAFAARTEAALRSTALRKAIRRPAHGDMHLANVILRPDGVVHGIDFCAVDPAYPAWDLARLLTHFTTFFVEPEAAVEGLTAARAAMLEGYGGLWRDVSVLDALVAVELARQWSAVPVAPSRRLAMRARRWARLRPLIDALHVGRA
ncbi:MAG: phosphotransferase [Pseudomonadota bacterium]